MKKLFTLIAVAAMAFAAQAATLTVCDAEGTSTNVPIYGLYVDTEGTMGQMIYPAEMLEDMVGAEITGVTFYSPSINFSDATLELAMAMTDKNDFEDYAAVEDATPLASLTPSQGDTGMTFVFDEPFVYEGGNLMVQVLVTTIGDWATTYFYGENTPYYYSYYQYQSSWSSTPSKWNTAFLPKVTFTYEKEVGPVDPPVDPTEKTDAPSSQKENYVYDDGNLKYNAYTVTLIETEPSTIYYRVGILVDGEYVYGEWMEYTGEMNFTEEGTYMIEAYAVAENKTESDHIWDGFTVSKVVDVEELMAGKTVASVRYFNAAGQEMQQANGLTIMVTTYTDGTSSAVKVVK